MERPIHIFASLACSWAFLRKLVAVSLSMFGFREEVHSFWALRVYQMAAIAVGGKQMMEKIARAIEICGGELRSGSGSGASSAEIPKRLKRGGRVCWASSFSLRDSPAGVMFIGSGLDVLILPLK